MEIRFYKETDFSEAVRLFVELTCFHLPTTNMFSMKILPDKSVDDCSEGGRSK